MLKGALGSFATFLLVSLKAVEIAPFTDSETQLAECLLEVSAKIFDHQVKVDLLDGIYCEVGSTAEGLFYGVLGLD